MTLRPQAWYSFLIERRGWALLLLLPAFPLFFIGGPDWVSPPIYGVAWSQGHMVFFGLLLFWVQAVVPLKTLVRWLAVTLMVVLLSLAIEAIQSQVGREANWQDGLRNLIGAWFGLFWGQRATRAIWLGRLGATVLLLWQLSGLAQSGFNHWQRLERFPILSDFETERQLLDWGGNIKRVREPVAQGKFSLALQLGTERYSGGGLDHLVGDWRGYDYLSLELYHSGAEPLPLTLRINDTQHDRGEGLFEDRFNQRLWAQPGWNNYRIALENVRSAPESRPMNMASIQRLGIFATQLPEPQTVYLDNVRLE